MTSHRAFTKRLTKIVLVSLNQLSDSAQNYLKIIFSLQEWSAEPVTASLVADRAGVKLSTVSGALSKLRQLNLLDHAPYGEITLTATGRSYALDMVRRHRLIETFLVQMLGYRWDQVHDEAENLEHAVSDFMVERIDELLGHPTRDPHGDPIPSAAGQIYIPSAHPLSQSAPGSSVIVERISDADSTLLQYFSDEGVVLGARLQVYESDPYSDTVEISTPDGEKRIRLGTRAAEAIWVSLSEQD